MSSEHPMFCVCDQCSAKVAAGHREGDERFGRNWRAGEGCGCAACRAYRKTLDDIDAGFSRIADAQKKLALIRGVKAS